VTKTVTLGNENEKLDLIDPKGVQAVAAVKAAGAQAADAGVAGVSESSPVSKLIDLVRESGDKLDFSALVDHVRDGSSLPEAWLETLHRGEEILKTADTDALADDLVHYVDLLGVRDSYHGTEGLVGA
jgi:hypothetical protein